MPLLLPEGIRVPAGDDPYALTADLRRMMESAYTIVPVANVAARNALVAALVAAGRGPTTARPLVVNRADVVERARFEVTYNGTTWSTIASGDTGWLRAVNAGGFNATNLELRKVGPIVSVRGYVSPTGNGSLTSSFVSCAALPAVFRESVYVNSLHPGVWNTTYNMVFRIDGPGGVIQVRAPGGGTYSSNTLFSPTGWCDAD